MFDNRNDNHPWGPTVISSHSEWDRKSLKLLDTIFQGQCCDCKINAGGIRVWVCRVAGGVTVEQYKPATGRWEIVSGACGSIYDEEA